MSDGSSLEPANTAAPNERIGAQTPASEPPPSAVRPASAEDAAAPGDAARVRVPDPANDIAAGAAGRVPTADAGPNGTEAANREKPADVDAKTDAANDVRPPPPDRETLKKRLAIREWHRKIVGWLFLKKFKDTLSEDEAKDIFHDACVRAMNIESEKWPMEEAETLPWLFKLTLHTAADHLRARTRRWRREVPLEDQDVAVETESAVEAKLFGRFLAKTVAETPQLKLEFTILDAYVDGMDAKDIAKELRLNLGAVYRGKDKASAFLKSGWTQAAAAVAVGFLVWFLVTRLSVENNVMVGDSHTNIAPDAPLLALPTRPTAPELRAKALNFCDDGRYAWCLEYLNHARRLDPAGEKDPAVAAARHKAEAVMRPPEKGGH